MKESGRREEREVRIKMNKKKYKLTTVVAINTNLLFTIAKIFYQYTSG